MMNKVGVGVIGSGSIAEIGHFPSIRDIPEAELVAICDKKGEVAKKAAEKWKARAWYIDYREMLEKENLDVCIIASPNNLHHEQALAVAEAGIHAIVEKPIACTNKEAWDIVEACKKAKVKLMVGCNQRFSLQHEIGKQVVDQGLIGDVKMGRSSLHEGYNLYHDQVSYTKFRAVPEEAGGGALFDVGAHRIDLLMWLMGSEVKRVVGVAKRTVHPAEFTLLDDTVWILMELANGTYGCVSNDRFSPVVSNISELYGTEGMMFMSSEATNPFQSVPLAVYINKDYNWQELPDIIKKYRYPQLFWAEDIIQKPMTKRWVSIYPPREWSYRRMLKHFIQCVFENKEPVIKPEDGAQAVEIMCAVFKSMETGAWVDLPLKEEVIPPHYKPRG
jgi:predicted dehydrogenase